MPLSSAAAITIAIFGALGAVIVAAAVHRVFTKETGDHNETGTPRNAEWKPNQYPQEQLMRLDEVRWNSKKVLWEIATRDRLRRGYRPADFYPGHTWEYHPDREAERANRRATMNMFDPRNLEILEQDIINNPGNIGHAYRAVPYLQEDDPDPDADEYGVPLSSRAPSTDFSLPHMLKRWTQHGAPRQSQQPELFEMDPRMPRLMVNGRDIPATEYDPRAEVDSVVPELYPRCSSVYSADTASFMPRAPQAAYVASQESFESVSDVPTRSPRPEPSRVHRMIEQWENANGAFSR